jgi:phosphate transport system permease protein
MAERAPGKATDAAFTALAWLCGIAGIALPLSILGFLSYEGISAISWSFITQPPRGFPLGSAGGIWPAIKGTVALVLGGLAIAWPCAVAGAIYLSEFCGHRALVRILRFVAELLASMPALIFGVWGFSFFVVACGLQISLAAGILTLAAVMFPIILLGSLSAFENVDLPTREAAVSLGVSRSCLARRILLRRGWPGILAATVLAAGHAAGSAAPVLFTASVYLSSGDLKLSSPVMTLPTHLYYLVAEGVSMEQAYATAFLLVAGLLLANIAAMALRHIGGRT